jgi:spore germination cell wall hydrolase CwlJ-like protein
MTKTAALAFAALLAAGAAAAEPLTVAELKLPIDEKRAEAFDPQGSAPLDDPLTCLARTIYWEAKGEPRQGKIAVAHVVRNRVESDAHPDTYCKVVKQGSSRKRACQFSWWCDGKADTAREREPFVEAREIARLVLNDAVKDPTAGSTYFHNTRVNPRWARKAKRIGTIGRHVFYVMN